MQRSHPLGRALASALTVLAVTAGLLVVSGPSGAATARAEIPATPYAHYDFSKTSGTSVPDDSGNGRTATIRGTGATVAGDELTLPGGANGSGAGYVELPTGMFDGQDTLTVSLWLKNQTGSGNYAAMFFGTTENLPSQYWLLNPANPAGQVKSVITDGLSAGSPWTTESGISPTLAARGVAGPVTGSDWAMYTTVITPTSITGYLDGAKIGTVATTRTVSQFGSNLVGYLGRSSYPDNYYKGGIRDVAVYTDALTDADVATLFAGSTTDDDAVQQDAAAITVPNVDDARGNITLPTTGGTGTTITWVSSAVDVITATGEVTRPANGQPVATVTLTATVTRGSASATRTITASVRPTPEALDYEAYFLPFFKGESTTDDEKIYFATSQGNDPQHWQQLNNDQSVLESTLGEKGLRDPFIIRSPEGDRFFLLATDLNMFDLYGRTNFGEAQESGSKNLMIWESTDLVNWGNQRSVKVSSDLAGNTWAPEAIWDAASGQYIVYWASNLYPSADVASRNFASTYNRMMYATTRDFVTFSEPKPWVDVKRGDGRGMIDADLTKVGDTFYRFIKDEASFDVRQERSTDVSAVVTGSLPTTTSTPGWQLVKEHVGVGQPNPWGGTFTQGEGPSVFADNEDPNHWYLLIDQPSYHGGQGYMLFDTHDIASGNWTSVPDAQLPSNPRHGTVLPITKAEHEKLLAAYPSDTETNYSITADPAATGASIPDTMFGIFFEDINWAADGGLYAELVRNRSFEFLPVDNSSYTGMTGWSTVSAGGGSGTATTVNDDARLNERNRTYLKVDLTNPAGGTFGVANAGYNNGVPLTASAGYDFSVFARSTAPAGTPIAVSLQDSSGTAVSDTVNLTVSGDGWVKYTGALTATATTDAARLVVTAGGTGTLRLDMISLFPKDTYQNRPNGLRKDLAEKIEALDPGFLRFPGGCIVNVNSHQGYDAASNYQRARSYQWKDSVGPVETRATNANFWGYNQTLGLGYFEYFQFAEDIGAIPVPDVPALLNGCGQALQTTDPAQLQRHIQDTLDLIEFANGDVTTTWGKLRADLGHPAPFNLERIEIGNEENYPAAFMANFVQFRDAIKAKYPDMMLISNSGPDDEGATFDLHWTQNRAENVEMVDEHYYNSPTWFLQNNHRYDSYDRNGPKVWVGEYASLDNKLTNALAEAAFMTGLQRNADVVTMASYAPLLANVDNVQWKPDMIWYDNDESWGSANYEVQKLFMNNVGDRVVPTTSTGDVVTPSPITGSVGLSTWSTSAKYDDITVTGTDGSTLFADNFDDGNADGWTSLANRGSWSVAGGAYTQSSTTAQDTLVAGPAITATDYDVSLKATKLAGAEGFLIGFGVKDSGNFYWWNVGGWNNTRNVIEKAVGGAKQTLFAQENRRIDTNRTYDVKIEVRGTHVNLYLDGVLQGSFDDNKVLEPFAHVLTKDEATGDLILEVVNAQGLPAVTDIDLGGATVASDAQLTVISGEPGAVNSRTETPVAPVTSTLSGIGSTFTHTFPANSVTVIRMSNGTPPRDTTAPVVSTSVDPASPTGADGWYTGPVTVTASATDDSGEQPTLQLSVDGGATWADYSAQTLSDGSHSLRFRAADAAGNVSDPVTVEVKVDTVVPAAAATVDAAARTVGLTGTDTGSGVARLEYKVDGAADWTVVAGASAVATVGSAAATVQYRAVDAAGNLGATGTATVPAVGGPRATVDITSAGQPSADGWYNQNVVVSITAPAGTTAQYRVDGGDWKAAKKSFTVAANGVHTVEHRLLSSNVVVDGSAASVCVKIDKQLPTAAVTRSPAATGTPRNPVSLVFSATDTLSGVAGLEYKVNQGDWTAVGDGDPVVLNTVGDYVVSYRSRDAAGNVSKERSTTASISADVATTVTAKPGKVKPGEYLTLNLAGFDRYDTVRITLGDSTLGTVFTDVKGAGKVTLAVPAGTPKGVATVTATGGDGEPTATAQVTVQ